MTTSERKSRKIYYTMGEVSEMFDVNPSLIRFWEQKFDILKPDKNKKGNRLFTPKDVENLKLIYHLVKENGMTLAGAAKRLRQNREGVSRDLEIIEKLQRVRSLLLDVREVLKAANEGDQDCELAVKMYVYKVQKAIGSYYAAMTRTDAVVMTAGIGENSAELRRRIFDGLAHMGMILDHEKNQVKGAIGVNRIVSVDDSPIKICVVTTDEEMRIARETDALVSGEVAP